MASSLDGSIPEATVARLPIYHRVLLTVADEDATISSGKIAEMSGVNSAKVRKDLSHLGNFGTRGVGYNVRLLLHRISQELGLTQDWPVAIVGFGNLGHALANYRGFSERGFRVAAVFDVDPAKVGETAGDLSVNHLDDLARVVSKGGISMAIIATPAAAAQGVADQCVAAGITSILNFAPTVITVPEGVSVRKVDLSMELQILSFYEHRSRAAPPGGSKRSASPAPSSGS